MHLKFRAYGSYQNFLDRGVAANKKVTKSRVPSGFVEVTTLKVLVTLMAWSTVTEYLCHK